MVLLTSSAVSAALSAGIVCTFTFLLFLSGYVLQQQTIRSLQEAIRNPPEKPWYPKPTLPPQFRESRNEVVLAEQGNEISAAYNVSEFGEISVTDEDTVNADTDSLVEPSPLQLWHDYVAKSRARNRNKQEEDTGVEFDEPTVEEADPHGKNGKYAYILSVPNTTDLCSVILFTNWYRQVSKVSPQASIVYVYPATWEMSDSPIHTGAMDLIREMQDKHDIICHPVSISRIWTGVSVESQLLAELQRTRWTYDRAIYFRSPGLALDIPAMDRALTSSSVKKSWQGISSKSTSQTPSLLLYVHENGLLAPRAGMRRLTSLATSDLELQPADGLSTKAKYAAYVVFDEKDLQHRRNEGTSSSEIFERFERERRSACAGTPILTRYDTDEFIPK